MLAYVMLGYAGHVYSQSQGQRNIVVLYENDVHCAMDGYAKLAGLRDAIADTADVFLVSNGDYVQGQTVGAISKGQYVVDVMQAMGYDAVTLGNHEFDYGMERMFDRKTGLCALCDQAHG